VHELALLWSRAKPAGKPAWSDDLLLQLEGVIADLCEHLALLPEAFRASALEGEAPAWVNQGRAKRLGALGFVAHVDPAVQRTLGLSGELASEVVVAVLSIDALLEAPGKKAGYTPIPRFPGAKVDVALSVPEAVKAADLVAAIERAGKGLVAACELFDVYQGPNLAAGRKSLAFHVLLQAPERTLDEQDGQKFIKRLTREVELQGGELRSE
jgi:phenylalanyl-tRNA synthetase beta chain